MSDLADDFNAMKKDKKVRHVANKAANLAILANSSYYLVYKNNNENVLFRSLSTKADFYPSSGKWTDLATRKVYSGGAQSFLGWLAKQVE